MSDAERSVSRSRSPAGSPRGARSMSRSRSRSPARSASPRGRSISPRKRSYSRSPRGRSLSRSRSPRKRSLTPRRSRSRSRAKGKDWRDLLEDLYDSGTVRKSDLDDMTMDALEDLSDELAECAVQRFSEANFSRITNKNGFFMGIIRRVKQDGPDRSGGDLKSLPRPIRHKLLDLIDDRRIREDDIDPRMCKALNELPVHLGIEGVDKFAMANLDTVRSKTGFMMGIIKRLQMEALPPPRYGGGGYGGGGHDRGYDRRDDRYNRSYDRRDDRYDRGYDRRDDYDRRDRYR